MTKRARTPHRNGVAKAAMPASAGQQVVQPEQARPIPPGVRDDTTFERQRAMAVAADRTIPIGVSGISSFAGYLSTSEQDRDLVGSRRWRTWDEIIANVEIVSTGIATTVDSIGKPAWSFEPADESREAAEVAEFVQDVFDRMATPWNRTVRKAAMHIFRGFSVFAWSAVKRSDGKIGIYDVEHRPQSTIDRWDLDPFGCVRGVVQRDPNGASKDHYIPRERMLHFVDDTMSDSPEGLGILRCVTKASRALERYIQLEGFGYEGDLRGIPVVSAPIAEMNERMANGVPGYSRQEIEAQLQHAKDFMEQHIRSLNLAFMVDSGVYQSQDAAKSPSGARKWILEVLQGGATSQGEVGRAIDRITTSIARRMGIEHLMMGGQAAGTFGASADKSLNLALRCDSALVYMKQVVQRDLVKWILFLNGIPEALAPTIKTEMLQWRSLADLAAFLRDRATSGVPLVAGSAIDNALMDVAGLPQDEPAMDGDAAALDASLRPGKGDAKDQGKEPAQDAPADDGEDKT